LACSVCGTLGRVSWQEAGLSQEELKFDANGQSFDLILTVNSGKITSISGSADGSTNVQIATSTTADQLISTTAPYVDGKGFSFEAKSANGTIQYTFYSSGTNYFVVAYNITTGSSLFGSGAQAYSINLSMACFVAGTRIATNSGLTAVEELKAGDLVLTAAGDAVRVRWMARSTVSCFLADPLRVLPIRIKAGALGEHLPVRDLLLSPGHAVALDGLLIHAGALVNGTSIVRETNMPRVFTYFHVELDSHALLLAEGLPAESYLDGLESIEFDNLAERPAATSPMTELPLPRAKSIRQVPRAIRERIAARAGGLIAEFAAAA
jgi:hypothetical protein